MNEKEFNLAILNKLYEIAKEVFSKHIRVPEGSYSATDLAKLGTSIFEEGYLQTEEKRVKENIGTRMEQTINKTCYVAPLAAVEYLTFSCSFCIATLFNLVAKFEKLAGIGNKKYIFVKANECAKVLSKVTVEITKDLATLCNCVANDDMRPIMNWVCLDVKEHKAVASDGHVMQVKYFAVVDKSEYKDTFQFCPLIPAKEFKKMCSLAGKSGANLTITLVEEGEGITAKQFWVCECKGITTKVSKERYPNYLSVMAKINTHNIVSLSDDTWKATKKWLKANKDFNYCSHKVKIKHEEGSDEIMFCIENIDFGKEVKYTACCTGVPNEKFAIGVSIVSLLKVMTGGFCIAIPDSASRAISYLGTKEYGICMPLLLDDDDDQWKLGEGTTDPMCFCDFPSKEECEGLDNETECANQLAERIETSKVVSNTTEQESEPQSAKEVENVEPTKEVTKSVTTTKETSTTKKQAGTTNKEQRKFSFEKIGVKAGDVLTFVDGTEVIATADGKVEFCGEVFTLSGFTKEFIPNPTKSGAYRGCAFFYKDGVKLEKLFKQYLATLDSAPEEIAATTEHVSEKLDEVSIPDSKDDTLDSDKEYIEPWEQRFNDVWLGKAGCEIVRASAKWLLNHTIYVCVDGKARMLQVLEFRAHSDEYLVSIVGTNYSYVEDRVSFTQFYHANEITKAKYEIMKGLREPPEGYTDYTLDSTATEPQKCALVRLKVESEVITPPSEEITLESQGEPPRAKVIRFDVGTLADIVSISLGVPSCKVTEPPPNMLGGAKVANRPYMWAAGNYSLTAGKVVHELPLPPPKQKRYDISQSIRYG